MIRFKPAAAFVVVAALATTFLLALAPAADAATPPYEPDVNAYGTLTFYNAAGDVITSGTTTDKPLAAYIVGSAAGRAGDKSTLLNMAQPNPNANTGNWNVDNLTGQTDYPLSSGPANIKTLSQTHPVSAGTSGDISVADFIGEFPNDPAHDSNAAYQNLYQLRLVTANGADQNPQYQVADILVSGSTWTQVYPAAATPPGVPTGVTATAGNASATVSWTAPGGSVTGYDVQYSSNNGSTWTSASSAFHTSPATTEKVSGLTNGSSYVFRVAAINGAGTSLYSEPTAAVNPVADTTSITISAPTSTKYGTTVAVTGTLKDSTNGHALASSSASLYRRASSTASWVLAKTVTSSSTGAVSVSYKFTAAVQLEYRYTATATHKAATSPIKSVSVAQVISAHVTPSTVTHGHSVKVYGTVSPAGTGQSVSLQRFVSGAWKTVATATLKQQTLPNHVSTVGFVFAQTLSSKGTYHYRIYKAKTTTLASALSATLTATAT